MSDAKEVSPGVTVDPRVRFGKPVIKGTRLPVAFVLYQLAAGVSMEEFAREFDVSQEEIRNAIAYAADLVAAQDPVRD
jgi:uncharacterized protein (DUF433 family)